MTERTALLIAISSGFLAVLLGAFGAHALKGMVPLALLTTWKTASFYHFIHTLVLLGIGIKQSGTRLKQRQYTFINVGFLTGILLFSGSLYIYVLTQTKVFAMVTPIGGVILLFSWAYWFKVELLNTNK